MNDPYPIADEARRTLAAALSARPTTIRVSDITSRFLWAREHRFMWGVDQQRNSAVVAMAVDGSIELLSGQDGLETLSRILVREQKAIPGDLDAEALAEAVRRLTVAPPGVVAKPDLPDRKSPPLKAWLPRGQPEKEALLRAQCAAPELRSDAASGDWMLEFRYFNPSGGVEQWRVTGDRTSIRSVQRQEAVPDGTFNWPYEG